MSQCIKQQEAMSFMDKEYLAENSIVILNLPVETDPYGLISVSNIMFFHKAFLPQNYLTTSPLEDHDYEFKLHKYTF